MKFIASLVAKGGGFKFMGATVAVALAMGFSGGFWLSSTITKAQASAELRQELADVRAAAKLKDELIEKLGAKRDRLQDALNQRSADIAEAEAAARRDIVNLTNEVQNVEDSTGCLDRTRPDGLRELLQAAHSGGGSERNATPDSAEPAENP